MNRSFISIPAAILKIIPCLVAIFLVTSSVLAQETITRSVSVSGEGIIKAEPDMATVRFGVVTRNENPEVARAENGKASGEAMDLVRKMGIEDRHIELEDLRLEPDRRYIASQRRYEEIGFIATRTIAVRIHDLDMLPTLVADVIDAGANRLSGVTYGLDDRTDIEYSALRLAVEKARRKAEIMAAALGAELGPVLTINEHGIIVPTPVYRMAEADMVGATMKAAPNPSAYAAGELDIKANVSVVFTLK